jgi:hypothetical protein
LLHFVGNAPWCDAKLSQPRAEEWLLIEWPQDETEPPKYWAVQSRTTGRFAMSPITARYSGAKK